ncbi:hypothetical protein [Janibacter sp. HTCC2649]|uniref:DUF7668 domain-containing protein n=1 Tax=Janibacter sp. HTCC2649 TaxID=313589 RepID=UPI000326B72F|nr:hypothetical protein [Janibacter sp. HTCC2649]
MGRIPEKHREAVRAALDELVAGRRPELMTWVDNYGAAGAELIPQPDDIWEHRLTDFVPRDDGTAYIVLPLWTSDEAPSDLSAECELSKTGQIEIIDVHAL